MIINGTEVQQHNLSYDKIIKYTLEQSDEMTIRFINGLFGDDIPLDAPVEWLNTESISDNYKAIVADFYPRIDGKMYAIEIEQDGSGDMAIRIFKYSVGGAMIHSMKSTKAELNITFPQPCVVFLSSSKNTPKILTWNIDFFDGQKVTLQVPTIHLADLSVEEIAKRNLFPVGQFYLRTFETLTEGKIESFKKAAESLLIELKHSVETGLVPYHVGLQMQDTIRKTIENTITKSEKEVGLIVTTNIVETLPWTDYREVFAKTEERGKAEGRVEGKAEGRAEGKVEGRAEGKAERDVEIALKMFAQRKSGANQSSLIQAMKDLGFSDETIEAARKQHSEERAKAAKERSDRDAR
jgi:hypothetical protein